MADTAKAAQMIDFAGGGQDGASRVPVSQVQQNAYKREGLFLPSCSGLRPRSQAGARPEVTKLEHTGVIFPLGGLLQPRGGMIAKCR